MIIANNCFYSSFFKILYGSLKIIVYGVLESVMHPLLYFNASILESSFSILVV